MKKALQSCFRAVDRFFFQPDNRPEFLVFFRVSVGIVVLMHFLSTIRDFDRLYSSRCIVPQDIITAFHPDWLLTFPKLAQVFETWGISESVTIVAAQALFIVFCLMIILGFYARLAAILLLGLQIALTKGSSFFIYGVDFFTSMSLFYLALFPADNYFSLRNFLAKRPNQPLNYSPVKRMFQLHLCIAYFFSGFDKLLGFNWRNGESIWKAINLPYANRDFFFDFTWMAEHSWVLVALGWATILIEMCYPIFVWIPKTRKLWVLFTVMMHLGIALTLNLYFFSAIMIVWNFSNFYFEPGGEWSFGWKRKPGGAVAVQA